MATRRRAPARQTTRNPARSVDRSAQQHEELTRLIVRALRRRVDDGAFSTDDAVDVTLQQIFRPGGPRLSVPSRQQLHEALRAGSAQLLPPSPRALVTFARFAAQAAWRLHSVARSPGAVLHEHVEHGTTRELAQAAVLSEIVSARNDEELLQRAVTRAVRERRKGKAGTVAVPLREGDPLRDLLDLPAQGRLRLPRTDVRVAIARVADGENAFGDALRKAARFDASTLARALGDELSALCRVVGFADVRERKVLVEVAASMIAQEVQLRSVELVQRLRTVHGFEQISGVQVVVVPPRAARPPRR